MLCSRCMLYAVEFKLSSHVSTDRKLSWVIPARSRASILHTWTGSLGIVCRSACGVSVAKRSVFKKIPWMCQSISMDVSSVRKLMALAVHMQTFIIFAEAVTNDTAKVIQETDVHQKPCCFNGGLCVLGSFCHCPKQFYGRYCEFELRQSPCGHIPHGSWVKAGCNLCRCYNGHMTCLPRAFDGCDDKPFSEVDPWDYKDEMVIFARDVSTTIKYDADDYDYYENNRSKHSDSRALSASAANVLVCISWTLALSWLRIRLS